MYGDALARLKTDVLTADALQLQSHFDCKIAPPHDRWMQSVDKQSV